MVACACEQFIEEINGAFLGFCMAVVLIWGYWKIFEKLCNIGDGSWGVVFFLCTPLIIGLFLIGVLVWQGLTTEVVAVPRQDESLQRMVDEMNMRINDEYSDIWIQRTHDELRDFLRH